MKIKLQIKNRFTGSIIFEFETENNTISKTIAEYIRIETLEKSKYRADLTRADLTDANLTDADLTRTDLTRADLTRTDLTRADLTDANLTRADLTDANLTDANLTDANLTRADLTRADLTDANLTDADLTRANLTDADLTDADLTRADLLRYKSDLWRVLLMNKNEVEGLHKSLIEGKINGCAYEGACACLKGTIANIKGCTITEIPGMLKDSSEPAEQWFLQIKPGMTPENSNVVKLTTQWVDEFIFLMG